MKVIVCLDERDGMCFNHRRQSRDRVVIEDILQHCNGGKLWMNAYSATLFPAGVACVAENFLRQASEGDHCFVEDQALVSVQEDIDTITVYRWQRLYPADQRFDIDLRAWHLTSKVDLMGYSHERITKEEYHR